MSKYSQTILSMITVLFVGMFLLRSVHVYGAEGTLTGGVKDATKAAYGKEVTRDTQISTIVGSLINGALGLLGTVFLLFLFIAGYHWMTAAGNEEEITEAKARIWQAIMGLIIVMAALLITQFVLAWVRNATIAP